MLPFVYEGKIRHTHIHVFLFTREREIHQKTMKLVPENNEVGYPQGVGVGNSMNIEGVTFLFSII